MSAIDYMWDELAAAAWLDPGIITRERSLYLDVDLNHGRGYGNTLSWFEHDRPASTRQLVRVLVDLDTAKFYRLFADLMSGPTSKP